MNIFMLDKDPVLCAKYHCDKHVVKMCLEYSQILQTAMNQLGYETEYRATHKNHPLVKWVQSSIEHWNWVHDLALDLNEEYKYRFEKEEDHGAITALINTMEAIQEFPFLYPNKGWTDPPQSAINKELRYADVVQSYRAYYREVKQKEMQMDYTKREKPTFLRTDSNG